MPHIGVISLQFDSVTPDDQGGVAVDFRPLRPLEFTAGQHGLWVIPRGGIGPFTIASAPEDEVVTLGTGLASQSRLKRALAALSAHDTVRMVGPLGHFTLDGTSSPVVMLAQGMGVTPFRAMLRHLALTEQDRPTSLVHVGATHPFRADTEAVASRASYPTSRDAFTRQITEVVADQPEATMLVSGSASFVSATVDFLRARGVGAAQIKRDTFWGYRTRSRSNAPTVPSTS